MPGAVGRCSVECAELAARRWDSKPRRRPLEPRASRQMARIHSQRSESGTSRRTRPPGRTRSALDPKRRRVQNATRTGHAHFWSGSAARMNVFFWLMLLALLGTPLRALSAPRDSPKPVDKDLPEALVNNNRVSAGRWRNGVLTLRLIARQAAWHPEGTDGPGLEMDAFAEEGRAPQIPAPLIHVPEGSEIYITVRNAVPGATLAVHGLHTRPGEPEDALEVPPGAEREVRFKPGAPGTYFYWATTTGRPFLERVGRDSQLTGAFIVDPPGESRVRPERVFVIGFWTERDILSPTPPKTRARLAFVINGRSWPHTGRLTYTAGEVVHWRVINGTPIIHPMHLHGHYYQVESIGSAERDTIYEEKERRLVVTERMLPGTTMSLSWHPTRPGNWLFHCHVLPHISGDLRMGQVPARATHAPHGELLHALESMAGLVLGVRVL